MVPIELVRTAPIARALQWLDAGFRLIFIDHRGHGRSDKPHEAAAYAMPVRVADVVSVLDDLDVSKAHVLGISWGGRLCFGLGEHAAERVRSLVIIGQQPSAMDPDGTLTRLVGEALAHPTDDGIESLVLAFESIAGPYPESVRATYLACDAAAMRAAWEAVIAEGAVSKDLGAWTVRCLICVAADDVDFFEQAERAAAEIPDALFVPIEGTDHLGVDTAPVDGVLPIILRTLRLTS